MSNTIGFEFGSFDFFCNKVSLPMCSLVGDKIMPECYSRNLEVKSYLIFQAATIVMGFVALIMAFIMIIHIKSKYTAVGLYFFIFKFKYTIKKKLIFIKNKKYKFK